MRSPENSKEMCQTFEESLTRMLQLLSLLRKESAIMDLKEEIGNEPWFTKFGHPLNASKDLAHRLSSQALALSQDLRYIVAHGEI